MVTISDKRLPVLNSSGNLSYYDANVVTANDYYPFGMQMPGRKYDAGSGYRYGFNGKEKLNEISGDENSYDFGERVYDPRLGKFLSIDKYTHKQPYYSPYIYAGDKPIWCIDKEGNQEIIVTLYEKQKDGTLLQTGVCTMWINTVEEAKGIQRDAYKINVVYEWQEHSSQVNPQTVETWSTKSLVSVSADGSTGLNKQEQQKRDAPVDYYSEQFAKFFASALGIYEIVKGLEDFQYGYGQEESGEYITAGRAQMYRIEGGVKMATFALAGAANKVGTWAAWELIDAGADVLSAKMEDWGIGNEKGNVLVYSALKFGKTFLGLKSPTKLVDALELASDLADIGIKGEALINELSKRGVKMSGDVARDKKDAANKALSTFKKHYQTVGQPAKIE